MKKKRDGINRIKTVDIDMELTKKETPIIIQILQILNIRCTLNDIQTSNCKSDPQSRNIEPRSSITSRSESYTWDNLARKAKEHRSTETFEQIASPGLFNPLLRGEDQQNFQQTSSPALLSLSSYAVWKDGQSKEGLPTPYLYFNPSIFQ